MYTPISERNSDTWYDPFGAYLPILLMVIGLAYFLCGIPASMLIDKYVNKETVKMLIYLIVGFVAGILTILIFILFLGGGPITFSVLAFGIYGSAGSFIFFIFMILTTILN
ncbi:hypothetical protein [Aquibacillus albus]|uniref:Na+-transporting methylmalonyl-CoA/oxaloacetate decarboxylase beta subunit n=1 Tax=Aquibacillus albus TaxID=1168171 RepID=A0ABS2N2N5_9BACI|nr:hypothetical protein [Aquibacillus albus]MBM7572356.1 Na+-transporting methylmalonyl-CoA/oxaloacetate decarboxylase beta subunit [Aquibacillus albus]